MSRQVRFIENSFLFIVIEARELFMESLSVDTNAAHDHTQVLLSSKWFLIDHFDLMIWISIWKSHENDERALYRYWCKRKIFMWWLSEEFEKEKVKWTSSILCIVRFIYESLIHSFSKILDSIREEIKKVPKDYPQSYFLQAREDPSNVNVRINLLDRI